MGRVYRPNKPTKERAARLHLLWEEAWEAALSRGGVVCKLLVAGAHYPGERAPDGQTECARFEETNARQRALHELVEAHYPDTWCLDPARLSAIPPGLSGARRARAKDAATNDAREPWRAAFYPSRFIDLRALQAACESHAAGAPLVLPTPTFTPVPWERKEVPAVKLSVRKKAAAPKSAPVPVPAPVAAPPAPEPAPVRPAVGVEGLVPRGYRQLGLADWQNLAA
jgi:hypothetical protein